MQKAWVLVLVGAVVLAGWCAGRVEGAPNGLKVGACVGGKESEGAPFVMQEENSPEVFGYDIDLWDGVVNRTKDWVSIQFSQAVASKDEAKEGEFKELLQFLGTEKGRIEPMPVTAVMRGLEDGTIDVGLCGMIITEERLKSFTFLPPYLHTGLTTLVQKKAGTIPLSVLLKVILGQTDEFAIFALQLLMILAIIFAHCIWRLERKVNTRISERYADGLWDSLWFAVVTATTVGYGDKTPETYAGKLLTIGWMIMGMFFVSLFVASITTALLNTRDRITLQSSTLQIASFEEMADLKIGTWMPEATSAVKQEIVGTAVSEFASQDDALEALLSGNVDVVVEDQWRAKYIVNMKDHKYNDKVTEAELRFSEADIGVGVRRSMDTNMMRALEVGMRDHTRGHGLARYQGDRVLWFGHSGQSAAMTKAMVDEAIADTLSGFNTPVSVMLSLCLTVWVTLVLYSNWRRIMAADRRHRMKVVLNLGKGTFSQVKFQKQCQQLYRTIAQDGRSQPTAVEVVQKLTELGQRVSFKDVLAAVDEVNARHEEKGAAAFGLPPDRHGGKDGDDGPENATSRTASFGGNMGMQGSTGLAALKKTIAPGGKRLQKRDTFKPRNMAKSPSLVSSIPVTRASSFSSNGSAKGMPEVQFNVNELLVSEEVFRVLVQPLVQPKEMDQDQDDSHKPCVEHHIVELRDDLTKKLNKVQKKLVLELMDVVQTSKASPKHSDAAGAFPDTMGPKLRDVFDGWRLWTLDAQASRETESVASSRGIITSPLRNSGASPSRTRRPQNNDDAMSGFSSKNTSFDSTSKHATIHQLVTNRGPDNAPPADNGRSGIVSTSTPPLWGILDSRLSSIASMNSETGKQAAPGGPKAAAALPQMMISSLGTNKHKPVGETFSARGHVQGQDNARSADTVKKPEETKDSDSESGDSSPEDKV